MPDPTWVAVDEYLTRTLVPDQESRKAFNEAGAAAGLRPIEVPPVQGKLLSLLCQLVGARRALEVGTLAGYSTSWLAAAVGADGQVTTCELDPTAAQVARDNLASAGLAERVEVLEGPAIYTLRRLADAGAEPYDFVFIDADKQSNAAYVSAVLELSHPGTVIVVDNVVRDGAIADEASTDPDVLGSRAVLELIGSDPRLDGTALQTVDRKGYDGLAIAIVR